MVQQFRTKKDYVPLIVEPHPPTYNGLPFVTLIQFNKIPQLVIIDNIVNDIMNCYVLDISNQESIRFDMLLNIASYWFDNNSNKYPISIEFSRLNFQLEANKIMRTYQLEFITRIIGPVFKYNMNNSHSIKRKRIRLVPPIVLAQ